MNTTVHQKTIRRLALSRLSHILLCVFFSYGFLVVLLLLAKISPSYIPVLSITGISIFAITILYWMVFQKSLTKKELLYRMEMLSKKAQEKNNQILGILKEDLADAGANSWKLALDKPRGNYQERYDIRDKKLSQLYLESAAYSQQEIDLSQLLNYFKKE
jgi:hypothetical protein